LLVPPNITHGDQPEGSTGLNGFPLSGFRHSLTLFSKVFATIPHCTCSLSAVNWTSGLPSAHFPVIKLLDKLIDLEIGQAACRQQQRRRRKTLPCHQAARQAHWSGNWTSGLPSAPILVVKLLDKLIGLEIGQVACRQHTSLSSSCSTSSLVWKLDKWLTVKLLDKLIGLEIGQAHCRQQRRRSEKKPLSISCSTSSLVWKLDKWPAVSNNAEKAKRNPCHQAARQAHWSGNWTSGLPSAHLLVIKLLNKLIDLEIGQALCRQQQRRSEKLPCHQAARQAHWSGNCTCGLPSAHLLVIKLLDKLIGLEIGQAHCCQRRRRSEKLPCHQALGKLIDLDIGQLACLQH